MIYTQTITWSNLGTTPFYWKNGIYGIYDNRLHIVGGVNTTGLSPGYIHRYDFIAKSWTTFTISTSQPIQYRNFLLWGRAFTQVGSKIYYIPMNCGGTCDDDVNAEIFAYDMQTSTFQDIWIGPGSNEPGGSGASAVCSGNGYIYVLGGYVDLVAYTVYAGAHKYNINGNAWSAMFNLPTPTAQGVCFYYNPGNRLYLFGGKTGNPANAGPVQRWTFVSDTTNTWSMAYRMRNDNNKDLMAGESGLINLIGTNYCSACILIYGGLERDDDPQNPINNPEFELYYVWKMTFGANINGGEDSFILLNERLNRPVTNGAIVLNPLNNQFFGPIGGNAVINGVPVNSIEYGCISGISTNEPCIITSKPTIIPTKYPTKITNNPTIIPTNMPTLFPTKLTKQPSKIPTKYPTMYPTKIPTKIPSITPTMLTKQPSMIPTVYPTLYPTKLTNIPTKLTVTPTNQPSNIPTKIPTKTPNFEPTLAPTKIPSITPTQNTLFPTQIPSFNTLMPTLFTIQPTMNPTKFPTKYTKIPTNNPSNLPTLYPTNIQTIITTIVVTDNNSQLLAGIPNIGLYSLIGGLFICICIAGCIIAFYRGRLSGKEHQLKTQSQLTTDLQSQVKQTHELIANLSVDSTSAISGEKLNTINTLPKSENPGMNYENNNQIGISNIELVDVDRQMRLSEGDYAQTKGMDEESSEGNDLYNITGNQTPGKGLSNV